PYTARAAEWLSTLVKGEQIKPRDLAATTSTSTGNADDHQDMMNQLGIKKLRPGANPKDPSIFNEANANKYASTLPDALTMKDGTKVRDAAQWSKRRAEIREDFEREIIGRVPKEVPKVKWEVVETTRGESGNIPTTTKMIVGHVDNRAAPQITVDIQANFTVP